MGYNNSRFIFSNISPIVRNILFVLLASYVVFVLIERLIGNLTFYNLLLLDPYLVINKFQVWRLITYAFLHNLVNPFHMLFNGLLFLFIGPELERYWGKNKFLIFIFLTALGGGIFVCLSYLLGFSAFSVVGFSAVSLGLLIAWSLTYSNSIIYIFGIIPLKGSQLAWVSLAIEVLCSISRSNTSSAAHFGGMTVGFILTLGLWKFSKIKLLFNFNFFKKY